MCLNDGHFLPIHDGHEMALQEIAALLVMHGKLRLVDVFGKHREIDLLNRRIVLA